MRLGTFATSVVAYLVGYRFGHIDGRLTALGDFAKGVRRVG